MVGGVGYMAGKSAANRAAGEQSQDERLAEMESQQAAASAPAPGGAPAAAGASTVEQLKQLAELRDSGVLTPEEFEREKQKILAAG
ncbi:MAG TPA: SHOCT domain-containing protein [Solirubrobacteraceae bacterium]|nr:SHOCT domain-containing protein [Solirubrobacteraceae bacterium]